MLKAKLRHFIECTSLYIPIIYSLIYVFLKIPKFKFLSQHIDTSVIAFLKTPDKINIIVSLCGILIGFFITSFAMILSSNKTMVNLVKGSLGKKFVNYFSFAVIINFIHIVILLIYEININNSLKVAIICCSFLYHFILSFRFIYVIVSIFNKNMELIKEELEEQERMEENEKYLKS